MGNTSNVFDFGNETLAAFLAKVVSDGTFADVITTLKFDEVGQEAVATQIDSNGGQLWANAQDDFILATYASHYRSTKVWRVATTTARDAIGSDDGLAVDDIGYTEDTNALFYVVSVDGPTSSTWTSVSAGSAETLATTLIAGNTTGGTDILQSAGDALASADGAVVIGGAAAIEQTEASELPGPAIAAGEGRWWIRDDSPNTPMFTDDTGVDYVLNSAGGGSPLVPGIHLTNLVARIDIGDPSSYPGTGAAVTDLQENLTAGTIAGPTYTNGALSFDGTSGLVAFSKSAAMDNVFAGGGTIIAFFRCRSDGEGSLGEIVNTGFATGGYNLITNLDLAGDGGSTRITFSRDFSGTDGIWALLGPDDTALRSVRLNTWNSIAVVYDDASVANVPVFYINGVRQRASLVSAVSTPVGAAVTDVGNALRLGNRAADDRTFDGLIDTFLAYDAAVSASIVAKAHSTFMARHGGFKGESGDSTGVDTGSSIYISAGDARSATGDQDAGHVFIRGGDVASTNNNAAAGRVDIRGGDTTEAGGGPLGGVTVIGGVGDFDSASRTVGDIPLISHEFGGGTISSGNAGNVTLFRGTDNSLTGAGGDSVLRAGDALAVGSGNSNGGELAIVSGQSRNNGTNGRLLLRSAGSNTGTGGVTGEIFITTQATNVFTGDPVGAQGGTNTGTGNINITTGPPGATSGSVGNINITAGNSLATTSNSPGNVSITAGSHTGAASNTTPGGTIVLLGGSSNGGTNSPGGDIDITAGAQTTTATGLGSRGGRVQIAAGASSSSDVDNPGGPASVAGGAGTGALTPAGGVTIRGGHQTSATGNSAGGTALVLGGDATGGGATINHGGEVRLAGGATNHSSASARGGNAIVISGNNTGGGSGLDGDVEILGAGVTPVGQGNGTGLIRIEARASATQAGNSITLGRATGVSITGGAGITTGAGRSVAVTTGAGAGVGAGGALTITGGAGGATGNGSTVAIVAGNGGATSGNAGDINLTPGTPTSGTFGAVRLIGGVTMGVTVSPAALVASQNNYTPGGAYPSVNALRLTPAGGGSTVTGLVATNVRAGQVLYLANIGGTDTITLTHDDAGSTAANRFLLANNASYVLQTNQMCMVWYDTTSSRWRVVQ